MYEIGKDIFKKGFEISNPETFEKRRLKTILRLIFYVFLFFSFVMLRYAIIGKDVTRNTEFVSQWVVDRADIVDRNGTVLAKNLVSGDIVLIPKLIKDKSKVAKLLHEIYPDKYSYSSALKFVNSKSGYTRIVIDANEKKLDAVIAAKIPGIEVEKKQKRVYPTGRIFSHAVGFVGKENRGLEGAERAFNSYLTQNTDPLILSLDARIQSIFYKRLSDAVKKYSAIGAMGMLMDSRTGEILAMVSLPDFDPENLNADPASNRMMKITRGVYELGSVFKLFNTAMAIENGIDKEYYIEKPFPVKNSRGRIVKYVNDVPSFRPPRPNLNIEEIMAMSCNAGSAQIALDLPDGTQQEFLSRINMDKPLYLEFGKTESPLMPYKWGPVEKSTVSYGHGISVTPMHLFLGFNSMVNSGFYVYPTLKKRALGEIDVENVLDKDISKKLNTILQRVVENHSGKPAKMNGMNIGGKTGTAEKYTDGKVDKKRNITVFTAAFPIEAPKYTIMVILDEPKGLKEDWYYKTSYWNSAPTAGHILNDILPLLF